MFSSNKIAVLLITDDPMLEYAIRHLFNAHLAEFELRTLVSFETLWKGTERRQTGVILVDISESRHIDRVSTLRERFAGTPVLCWCSPAVPGASATLRELCEGVVSRLASGKEMVEAISRVAGRAKTVSPASPQQEVKVQLTFRESQLMTLLAQGYKNKEISACLGITPGTVKVYLSNLFRKTGAKDRFELNLLGFKNSLFGCAELVGEVPTQLAAKRAISRPMLTSMRLKQPASGPRALNAMSR